MITNKKMYEMITENMNDNNQALREQLQKHLETGVNESQTMIRRLTELHQSEITELTQKMESSLSTVQEQLSKEIVSTAAGYSQMTSQKLMEHFDQKMNALRAEFMEKMDAQHQEMMKNTGYLFAGIANLQKDTAIIMETLQLILTNMMLDNVEDELVKKHIDRKGK